MTTQKKLWKEEGNKWFIRNESNGNDSFFNLDKETINLIQKYDLNNNKILEIGCSNGSRLHYLNQEFKASEFYGIDPSDKAIADGKQKYPKLNLAIGTADQLDFKNESFDIVIFGFCLMVVDLNDLFKIVYEADRVLKKNGTIILIDWFNNDFIQKKWHWNKNVNVYKFDHSRLFLSSPLYTLISRTFLSMDNKYQSKLIDNIDDIVKIDIVRKNMKNNIIHR